MSREDVRIIVDTGNFRLVNNPVISAGVYFTLYAKSTDSFGNEYWHMITDFYGAYRQPGVADFLEVLFNKELKNETK